jgi:hypothetical protein
VSEPWRAYIEKARQSLDEARAVADIKLFEAAGRAALPDRTRLIAHRTAAGATPIRPGEET